MPNDYCVNKVLFGNTTVMDISDTTASPEDVAEGEIFYAANGARSVGTGTGGSYVLPIASANILGGIKVGSNLSIDENSGVLNADDGVEAVDLLQSTYDALPDTDKNDPLKIYFVGEEKDNKVVPLDLEGLACVLGDNIWTDGTNTYYSNGTMQYKLNGTTWEPMTWSGLSYFSGDNIWNYGNYIIYSNYYYQYRLNGTTWEPITWSGFSYPYGKYIWSDGTNYYYSDNSNQYKLNGITWEPITWNIGNFRSQYIWTDGNSTYYSNYSNQYKLNGTTWESITWSGFTNLNGIYIWNDGNYIYYSAGGAHYKLNSTTWEEITWNGYNDFIGQYIWKNGLDIYYSNGYINTKLNGSTWNSITWNGFNYFDGNRIWTDGINIYYSNYSDNFKLNGLTWEPIAWNSEGTTSIDGKQIWTDGTHIYYSDGYTQCVLVDGNTWRYASWNGFNRITGINVWNDGNNFYYSYGAQQYKLNGTTWETTVWSGLTDFYGANVWMDGNNIYYSGGTGNQYRLNGTTWEPITWGGYNGISGICVWSDGNSIYYSIDSTTQYKLNGNTWEPMSWEGYNNLNGQYIWTDGNNVYYSYSADQYKITDYYASNGIYYKSVNYVKPSYVLPAAGYNNLGGIKVGNNLTIDDDGRLHAISTEYFEGDGIDINETTISLDMDYLTASRLGVASGVEISQSAYDALPDSDKNNPSKIYFVGDNNVLIPMTWTGLTNFYGFHIWSDGVNVYYSYYSNQYKLNGTSWEPITWSGYTDIIGEYVWTDGTHIYYSYGSNQYKLNGTTWEVVSWSGLTNISGDNIWTDGTNTYYSRSDVHYKLNGTTWESVTWEGRSYFEGKYIWTDGENIYYSNSTSQYKLNGTTWESMAYTWSGLNNFDGNHIWTDNTDIYYSQDNKQYKLNGTTWSPITWKGYNNIYGNNVWNDGENIYYSGANQYKIVTFNSEGIYYKNINYVKMPTASEIGAISSTEKGANNGIATLDSIGKVTNSQLPIASAYTLGGVKVGNNLSIDNNGVLSATGGGSSYSAGDGIDIENSTISLDIDYLTASRLRVVSTTEKGTNNGVATLDNTGRVPSSQLPSYVDDVLEYANLSSFPATGESGKIYVALDTNKTYRWGGTAYVEISGGLALGETTGTAYEGNKGKANADNISTIQGLIPSNATTSNKLATASDIPSTTNFVQKSATAGLLKNDGTVDTNTYLTQHQDISGKADKVLNATNGNFAALDTNGNLIDSGHKHSDYAYTLPIAGANTLGGIKVGNGLSIDSSTGVLSSDGGGYTLPVASASTLGGIKIGNGLQINNDICTPKISVKQLVLRNKYNSQTRWATRSGSNDMQVVIDSSLISNQTDRQSFINAFDNIVSAHVEFYSTSTAAANTNSSMVVDNIRTYYSDPGNIPTLVIDGLYYDPNSVNAYERVHVTLLYLSFD